MDTRLKRKAIDFHTHTFPDHVAKSVILSLSQTANTINHVDGTIADLISSSQKSGIESSVVMPVASKIGQYSKINSTNREHNHSDIYPNLIFFAAIHPLDEDIYHILNDIKANGFKGIKLHPVYQNLPLDDIHYIRLIDKASELGLITLIHAGIDIGYPDNDFSSVKNIISLLKNITPQKLILAHMGGWAEWDKVESDLTGAPVYFDTAFSLTPFYPLFEEGKASHLYENKKLEAKRFAFLPLDNKQFTRIVNKHGAEKILFGSDSPWSSQTESIEVITNSGLNESSINSILYENAHSLLN